jgi:hypothetical protein
VREELYPGFQTEVGNILSKYTILTSYVNFVKYIQKITFLLDNLYSMHNT